MKLYIVEAFALAIDGDIKGAFAALFQGVQGPDAFFADLIDYLRRTLGVGSY